MLNYPEKFIAKLNHSKLTEFLNSISLEQILFIEIDGANIKEASELYKSFSKIIGFPEWFGANWNAFWDIMTDEDFINKDLVLVIKNYQKLFFETEDGYEDEKIFDRILIDLIQVNHLNHKIQILIIDENKE